MSKKILITGAYGLVGSAICRTLEKDYPEIEFTKVKCDEYVGDYEYFDYIIHGAGYGQPQMFGKNKIKTIEINTTYTSQLFHRLKKDGKFLFISSSEVYSGAKAPHTEEMIGTTTPQHPRACYIEGKRCGEAICMAYKEQGYDVKIARLALAYGPGTKKGDTRVLNQFIEQALTKKKIEMLDDGKSERTYLYVEDAARMILDILFKGKDVVYNVGGFSHVSIYELATLISNIIEDVDVVKGPKALEGAPSEVGLNMKKTVSEFGGIFTDIETGLKATIEYQKKLYGVN